jgi:hypothetical protein
MLYYFCFILAYKASLALCAKIKQKYQNGNIKNLDYELVVHEKAIYRLCTWLLINQ